DREGEAVAGEPGRVIGVKDHVSGGVVGVTVHGVRPGEGARGREAHVAGDRAQDPGRQGLPTTGRAVNLKAPMFVNPPVFKEPAARRSETEEGPTSWQRGRDPRESLPWLSP